MLDWDKYIAVAERFQHKAKAQDREDLKHTIILRLAQVASNNGHKPFTEAAMYRVANYWRTQYRLTNGIDCGSCSKAQRQKCKKEWLYPECPKAVRIEYLSKPIIDSNGNMTELGELIADDKAIDLDAWLDAETFLLGFPKRLLDIAHKRLDGIPLDNADDLKGMVNALKRAKRARVSFEAGGQSIGGYSLIIDTELIRYKWVSVNGDFPDYEKLIPTEFNTIAHFDTVEAIKVVNSLKVLSSGKDYPFQETITIRPIPTAICQ